VELVDAEVLGHEIMLGAHHVANGVARELGAKPVLGLAREPAPDPVNSYDEVLVGVEGFARADEDVVNVPVLAGAVRDQDGVGLLGVERPVGRVADLHGLELLAVLEGELRDGMGLVGLREGRPGCSEPSEDSDHGEALHCLPPLLGRFHRLSRG
jgi:hypothetical protein